MELQPKLIQGLEAVKELEQYYDKISFVIAGGAVRDQIMGKPINDIDIYCNLLMKSKAVQKTFLQVLDTMFSGKWIGTPTTTFDSKYNKFHVTSVELIGGPKLEFISIDPKDTIASIIDRFDIGLCQASIYKEKLWTSDEFQRDKENKTLTVYPNRLSSSQICRCFTYHLPKLILKYPEHEVRVSYE